MITLVKDAENLITDALIACSSSELDKDDIKSVIEKVFRITSSNMGAKEEFIRRLNITNSDTANLLYFLLSNPVILYIYFKSVLNINFFSYVPATRLTISYSSTSRLSGYIDFGGEQELKLVIPQEVKYEVMICANSYGGTSSTPPIVITTEDTETIGTLKINASPGKYFILDECIKIVLPPSIKSVAPRSLTSSGVNVYYTPINGKPDFTIAKRDKEFFEKHLKIKDN